MRGLRFEMRGFESAARVNSKQNQKPEASGGVVEIDVDTYRQILGTETFQFDSVL
jgi:hypothetical protein